MPNDHLLKGLLMQALLPYPYFNLNCNGWVNLKGHAEVYLDCLTSSRCVPFVGGDIAVEERKMCQSGSLVEMGNIGLGAG